MSYTKLATDYADGVRALFTPSVVPEGERGGQGPKSYDELADQAEKLLPVSTDLTRETALLFGDTDQNVRVSGYAKLMAKAMTDLEVCAYLLQAAVDEEKQAKWTDGDGADRSGFGTDSIESYLDILLDKDRAEYSASDRSSEPKNIFEAKAELKTAVGDTLSLILQRAAKSGRKAVGGVMDLGISELAEAAGISVKELAEKLGEAEKIGRLYGLFRGYLVKAYESIVAILGEATAEATKRCLKWLKDLNSEENAVSLLDRYYKTGRTRANLEDCIEQSEETTGKYMSFADRVNGLNKRYLKQVKLSESALAALEYLSDIADAVLPHGKLVTASFYILLGTHVILVGGDYVDAPGPEMLDRIHGVRHIVESNFCNE